MFPHRTLPRPWLIGALLAVALCATLVAPGLWHKHAGGETAHSHGSNPAHSHTHGHAHHTHRATGRPLSSKPVADADRWHQHVSLLGWTWTVWAPQEWLAAGWSPPPVDGRTLLDWLSEFRLVPFPGVNRLLVRLPCARFAGARDERAASWQADPPVPPPRLA